MVSPGTGAGMKARATDGIKGAMNTLAGFLKNFEPGTPEYNAIITSIKALNAVFKRPTDQPAVKPPIPVPATPPGAGLGGLPPQAAPAAIAAGAGAPSEGPPTI